jgi:arylsulfatase A-like enzyme
MALRSSALLALALAAGCSRSAPLPPARLELAQIAAAARLWSETRSLDIGTPAARPALWSGWGPDESGGGATFAWGGGERSRLRFDVVEPRPLTLKLRAWSYPFPDGRGQEVRFVLNGVEAGRREVPPAPTAIELRVGERDLRRGENILELHYERHHEAPGESPWAVAWDGLRIEGATSERAPSLAAAKGAIELPAGSAVEWTLPLPAGSYLAFDALESRGTARLAFEGPGGEHRFLRDATEPVRIELPRSDARESASRLRPARLVLAAVGESGSIAIEGFRLHLPAADAAAQAAAAPAGSASAAAAEGDRPNLVVYLIDTLRSDRLGCYGYTRPTSPRIDRFASSALLFREGRAQSSWTRPAVATILTGLAPWAHGVEERSSALPEEVATIGERLAAVGYDTALFTTNANIVARFGFAQGWETFAAIFERSGGARRHVDSAEIHRHVVSWLDARGKRGERRPFLLVVHTLDPHDPYRPAEPFRRALAPDVDVESACCGSAEQLTAMARADPAAGQARAAAASELYDAEVAQNDAAFGALLDELERRGLAERTAVLLTSDHGEEFFEHGGWKHGLTLYEELLRVPMVLRLPGGSPAGRVVDEPAEQIDIVPTLLDLADLPVDALLPGRSLIALDGAGPRVSTARLVRAGVILESAKRGLWKLVRRRGPWVAPLGEPPYLLFDLAADRDETADLALARRDERRYLDGELERVIEGAPAVRARTAPIDAELDRALKALGYL